MSKKLKIYVGTKKPPEYFEPEPYSPDISYAQALNLYNENPWFFFYASDDQAAILIAKQHNLKNISVCNHLWTNEKIFTVI